MNSEQTIDPPKRKRGRPPKVKLVDETPSIHTADVSLLVSASGVDFTPNAEQKRFAEIVLTRDSAWTYTDIAKELGVKPAVLSAWFNDPRFRIWLENIRHQLFLMFKAPIDIKLIERAMGGSYKHMELYYQMAGEITRIEGEKTKELREFESMTVSEQFAKMRERMRLLLGRTGDVKEAGADETPALVVASTPDDEEDDE